MNTVFLQISLKSKGLIILALVLLLYACQTSTNEIQKTTQLNISSSLLSFDRDTIDVGNIKEGKIVTIKFPFRNTGKKPLILFDVRTSCGCTAANWPTKPVKAGGSDTVTVKFDSSNRNGDQKKLITIFSNSPERVKMLLFSGNVKE